MFNFEFYKNKTVLVTGHTGFKGSWLVKILNMAGAKVIGYSLESPTNPNLFTLSGVDKEIVSIIGDVRDYEHLKSVFDKYQPEIVLHLAAQPIVRDSYKLPRYTYDVNVMGTVNILECCRLTPSVKSVLNITTDKVYLNNEEEDHPFKEEEPLDGFDPYSNSKSCSELVTHSYKKAFFDHMDIAVSTARAGNVIGGGDFSNDRIIPDAVRAIEKGEALVVRNPYSTRPYQHVLEPLAIYLTVAQKQYQNHALQGYYNVGPDECDCVNTGTLVDLFKASYGDDFSWINKSNPNDPHEASFLKLDSTKVKETFGYAPRWHIKEAIEKTVEWTRVYLTKGNISKEMEREIKEFLNL